MLAEMKMIQLRSACFSALQRAEIAEIASPDSNLRMSMSFSALQRAEIAEMRDTGTIGVQQQRSFSALQRAEIAEIYVWNAVFGAIGGFSALQRAEIAEIAALDYLLLDGQRFSALQRAEIAEIELSSSTESVARTVSVLFNEPKLLKLGDCPARRAMPDMFQCSSTSRNC